MLHTWSNDLRLHPHVHCVVTGAAWRAGQLPDPPGRRFDLAAKDAWRKKWVVHVDPPQGRDPAALTKYLARYVRGVAVSDRRIVQIDGDSVLLRTRRGVVRLTGHAFVRRFAQHILPRRFHAVRYWDLYAPTQAHTRRIEAWRRLQARAPGAAPPVTIRFERRVPVCPRCAGDLVELALSGVPMARPGSMGQPRAPP